MKKYIKGKIARAKFYCNTHGKYNFSDRSKGKKYACVILAGYKEFLWDTVFSRISGYITEDIDVCIVSSGLYSERLDSLCNNFEWSYLSVSRNNLCLAQNIAIRCLEKAEFIYKLDEDMFVTKEFFPMMRQTYERVTAEGLYTPGFIAPLIPINGYGYIRLLHKWGRLGEYERKFGKAYFTGGNNDVTDFTKNPEIPVWFWSKLPEMRDMDASSEKLSQNRFEYSVCPFRFSIGAIYFRKELWKRMGAFDVNHTTGMSLDEIKLCTYCNTNSLAAIVSENCLVGHLAYGPQMHAMTEYYEKNRKQFEVAGKK